jgi:hypothetical protein
MGDIGARQRGRVRDGRLRHERHLVSDRGPAPEAWLDTPPACSMSSTARHQFVYRRGGQRL